MLPPKLIESLEGLPGFDREEFEGVHAKREQVVSVRFNPAKTPWLQDLQLPDHRRWPGEQEAWQSAAIPWCAQGRRLPQRPYFTADPLLHAGVYYVQEASSMFLHHVLESVLPGSRSCKVLDLCGAPGGKSTLLSSFFHDGLVVSNEVIRGRVSVLAENLVKWGEPNTVITSSDPSRFGRLEGFFDVMVIDAPCSGSGLFRRDPDAVREWSPEAVELCSSRQQRILQDAVPALGEGGLLIYSTCSYSREENEDRMDAIVSMGFENIRIELPEDWNIVRTQGKSGAEGYRFYPNRLAGEGFFISVFRKTTGERNFSAGESLPQASAPERSLARQLLQAGDWFFLRQEGEISAFPAAFVNDLQTLRSTLYIRSAGIRTGTVKGDSLVPHHALALSWPLSPDTSSIDLDLETAQRYLSKATPENLDARGWTIVRYLGVPLGWVKGIGNRINNYYPAEWRIRNLSPGPSGGQPNFAS